MPVIDRTTELLSFSRCALTPGRSVEELRSAYAQAQPYPHLVLDGLFPDDMLTAVTEELPPLSSDKWIHERSDAVSKSNLRSAVYLERASYDFASMLHSASFLYLLSEITGVSGLLPDPYLGGAGYHLIQGGGKFDVHADRNIDFHSGLRRRMVMIVYLNEGWQPRFGGQLEIWNQDATRCEKVVEPVFNRTILFEIGDKNFHAVRPVTSDAAAPRRSFAAYFHTVDNTVAPHSSIFAPPLYQPREGTLRRVARQVLPPIVWETVKKARRAAH